jgi:hypothetical protein
MRIVILVLAVTLCPIRSALTWGDTGHRPPRGKAISPGPRRLATRFEQFKRIA